MFKPKFKSHFHVEVLPPDNVFLLSENDYLVLNGKLYAQLAPLMDGQRSMEEITKLLENEAPFFQIQFAVSRLRQRGFIENAAENPLSPQVSAFCDMLRIEGKVAHQRLQEKSVTVSGYGTASADDMTAALQNLGIQVKADGDLLVVVTDDYLQAGLDELNRHADRPWMLVKPVGAFLWMGPIFRPGETACWTCLENRLEGQREVDTFLREQNQVGAPFPVARAALPATSQSAVNLAAVEVLKWLITEEYKGLENTIVSLNTLTMEMDRHTLVRRPQCKVCGDFEGLLYAEPQPLVLNPLKKRFISDGGHRAFTPEETYARYEHHISPITGIISNLHLRVKEEDLIYIYGSAHNLAMKHYSWEVLRNSLFLRSAGKGKSIAQAKASAIGESLERYSAVFQGYESRKKGTWLDMQELAPHPTSYLLYSEAQYENRHAWFQKGFRRHYVPNRFEDTREVEWTPVWSLTENRYKYMPAAFCYYGYWPPADMSAFCWSDSNGAAAGNTPEEAIFQGFMEVIERDCIAMWWYNQVQRPGIDIHSFKEPYFEQLVDYYHRHNHDVWLLDFTNDIGIPCFGAVSPRKDTGGQILVGFGAHLDPKIAAARALTEVNEMLAALTLNTNDGDADRLKDNEISYWMNTATIESEPYLLPNPKLPVHQYSDFPLNYTDDLREDIYFCVNRIKELGMETLVLNHTRPDIGMSVFKVTVPGLRHFWARYAPGRLYDIPVQLGWLDKPTAEDDLNPRLMFF